MTGVEILDVTKKFRKETTEVVALTKTSLAIEPGSPGILEQLGIQRPTP